MAEISLRAYFAAHAPYAPSWFRVPMDRPCPSSDVKKTDFGFEEGEYDPFEGDEKPADSNATPEQWAAYAEAREKAWNDQRAWQAEHEQLAYWAWPWHYADMMLKAGGTSGGVE